VKKDEKMRLALCGMMVVFLLISGCAPLQKTPSDRVCIDDSCFMVEIADNEQARQQGLMYRKELAQGNGMLFIFEKESRVGFWMKNTLIPLDMIFISSNLTVAYVASNVQPCKTVQCPTITPPTPVKYVLEINAGLANKKGIAVGDVISFPDKL
jgi:uncharacterized protein